MIRLLLTDDHPIFRAGLRQVLTEAGGFKIEEATGGRDALEKARRTAYDVITLDLSMPDMDGLEVLKQLRAEGLKTAVLVLSIYPEEQFAIRALKAGASGYLTKASVPTELVEAVRQVAAGNRYITRKLAERIAGEWAAPVAQLPHERLSDREYEVFRLIAEGKTVSDIAAQLNLSVKTISTHRAHILEKTGLETNAQIMRYALDHQLVK